MSIETQIKHTIKKYKLCSKKEKVLVALSGGKDSSVGAYLLKKFGYNIEGFHIDLGMGDYSKRCLEAVKKLAGQLNIRLYVYDIKKEMGNSMCYIRSSIQGESHGRGLKNCAICGVIKKWIMNKEARKLGVKKIATGHNLDDECQTFFMNMLKGSPQLSANSGAITQNTRDKKFITRIKPLFYIAEEGIKRYSKRMKLPVVYERCPCAIDSYRIQVRDFMNTLTTREKEDIMKNFEKLFPFIQRLKREERLRYCEICGEPSRNNICRMCMLVKSNEKSL
jgi:uncharacterized protein (TIGR00269 family)